MYRKLSCGRAAVRRPLGLINGTGYAMMIHTGIRGTLAYCAAVTLIGGAVQAGVVDTSFESSEGFTAGASVDGVNGWAVENDRAATVTQNTAAKGDLFVALSEGAILDYSLSAPQTSWAGDFVWVEGFFRGVGSASNLNDALAQYAAQAQNSSAIVHFSSVNGIELLDGDGANSGNVVQSTVSTISSDTWYKITLQLDFDAKEWKVWIDGVEQNGGAALGFANGAVNQLNGFKNLAETPSDFDAFRIVRSQPGDANGDSRVDAADLVKLVEYAASGPEGDVIAMTNGNVATEGASADVIDDSDIAHLAGMLTGMTF